MDRNPIFMEVPTKVDDYFAHDRHVLCPNYSICLDEAIRRNQYFDCGQCLFKINGIKTYSLFNRSVPENLKILNKANSVAYCPLQSGRVDEDLAMVGVRP